MRATNCGGCLTDSRSVIGKDDGSSGAPPRCVIGLVWHLGPFWSRNAFALAATTADRTLVPCLEPPATFRAAAVTMLQANVSKQQDRFPGELLFACRSRDPSNALVAIIRYLAVLSTSRNTPYSTTPDPANTTHPVPT